MSRVLVTGGAGAIGSHLVARLLGDGHEVTAFDDLSSGSAELVVADATLVEGSIVDPEALATALADGPEFVFHLAARFANQNSVDHPVDDLLVNGLGTLAVLDGALASGVRKVLITSSSCVYEGTELKEASPGWSHQTPYAITKALGEQYARFFADHNGLDVVVVRPFNSYGPHELPGPYRNVIPNFIATAMRGEPLTITGTGEETRDFTYVGDIVDGMVLAQFGDTDPGEVFNLGSGRPIRIMDLAERINRLVGNTAGVQLVQRRSWDGTRHRLAVIDRARTRLGFEPSVSLDDGLAATHEWLRDRLA
jgi:UDP-glucose 4-epimerase